MTQSPQPPPEHRRHHNIINIFVRLVPLGASGWILASSFFRQDWVMTILSVPTTGLATLWAVYSQNFIEQLQTVLAERGKNHANQLVSWVDSAVETAKWQLSGFEMQYLDCQRGACQDDEPIGVRYSDRIFTPLLQEVYVPLRLSTDSITPGLSQSLGIQNGDPDSSIDGQVLLIWDLLQRTQHEPTLRQIAIRAWGGYGKTTLLKHITYSYSTRPYRKRAPRRVPFLLYLARCRANLRQLPADDPLSLPTLLTDYHLAALPQGTDLTPPPNWARDLLKSDRAIVLFDGFDEVPPSERADISHWLSQQMRHYPKTVFILTSRPAAYQKDFTAKRPTASFWVDTFNANQRQRFVEQWYTCQERLARAGRNTKAVQHIAKQKAASLLSQIASRPELNDLAGNALLLNMMARFHREKDGVELPNRKVELYQDICSMQLDRRPKARGIELWLGSSSQRQEVLQSVALAMMQRASDEQDGFKQVHHQALLDLLTPPLHERDASIDPEDFLAQIVDVSELMVDKEGRIYEFAHLSFQEFLAASELARLKREDLLYTQLDVDAWKPTLLLYADLVNPTHLIREALARQAVDLAYYIWRNTSKRLDLSSAEQRELEALKSTVQTSRFAQLETYLQQGQWEEADEETYRLMITAVGKEEGQWFKQEDLLNFPCDDLLAIDRLWMHHSQGHFGFSVQKTIYLSPKVGGNADGQYDKRSWNKFCHEVGWLLNSQFRVTYNTTSPKGHLPRWRQKGIIGEISLLFSHIQASEL